MALLRTWLRASGLRAGPASGDGLVLPATGSAAGIEQAFQTPIRLVRLPGGRIAHVNTRAAMLPQAVRPWVIAVLGLDSLIQPQSYPLLGTAARAPPLAPGFMIPELFQVTTRKRLRDS